VAWLKAKDAAVPGRNPYAPTDIRPDAKGRTIRGENRALAAGGATGGVRSRPRVARAAPERVRALEGEHRLRHIRLGDDDGARCA
jgi:hypothetical protein